VDDIWQPWIRNEATRLAEVFSDIRVKHVNTTASLAWLMTRCDYRAGLFEEERFQIPDWTYFDTELNEYRTAVESPPEFVSAFLASGGLTGIGDPPKKLKRTIAKGNAHCRASISGNRVPDSWGWETWCQINRFESDFPVSRSITLIDGLAASSPELRKGLESFGFAVNANCPTMWFLFLAYLSEFELIPAKNFCRTQFFAVRHEGKWLMYGYFPERGSWDLVSSSLERRPEVMAPKWDVNNGRIWVGANWEDFFKVCEMACLWIAAGSTPAPTRTAAVPESHSKANLETACSLAQQCILKGNSLIQTAATSPHVEQFLGEDMEVDTLPAVIFAFLEFLDDAASRLNSVRSFYSGLAARVVQIENRQGLCFHGIAWDFAHRIWGHVRLVVSSVWALNPVGEDPVMPGFRFLIDREAILTNLEEIRTTLKELKPIEDGKRFRLELQAEFLQGVKVLPAFSATGSDCDPAETQPDPTRTEPRVEADAGRDSIDKIHQQSDIEPQNDRTASALTSAQGKESSGNSKTFHPVFRTVADDYRQACLKERKHLPLKTWLNSRSPKYFKKIGYASTTICAAFNDNHAEWWPQFAKELTEAGIRLCERTRQRTGKKKPTLEK